MRWLERPRSPRDRQRAASPPTDPRDIRPDTRFQPTSRPPAEQRDQAQRRKRPSRCPNRSLRPEAGADETTTPLVRTAESWVQHFVFSSWEDTAIPAPAGGKEYPSIMPRYLCVPALHPAANSISTKSVAAPERVARSQWRFFQYVNMKPCLSATRPMPGAHRGRRPTEGCLVQSPSRDGKRTEVSSSIGSLGRIGATTCCQKGSSGRARTGRRGDRLRRRRTRGYGKRAGGTRRFTGCHCRGHN
jgi:hypothetical protein